MSYYSCLDIELSIIIPHYNSPTLLSGLLDSIGIHKDVQVIVVDDKSDAYLDTYHECKEHYKDNVLFLENNRMIKSAGTARNIGLEQAKGHWVLFADTDDYFLEGWYKNVSIYFASDFDVVFFPPTSIDLRTNKETERAVPFVNICNDIIKKGEKSSFLNFVVPWSKLISMKLIRENNIRFDETICANDVLFSTKVGVFSRKFCASEKNIYCVTSGKSTLSVNHCLNSDLVRCDVLSREWNFLKEHKIKVDAWYPYLWLREIAKRHGYSAQKKCKYIYKQYGIHIYSIRMLNPSRIIKGIFHRICRLIKQSDGK